MLIKYSLRDDFRNHAASVLQPMQLVAVLAGLGGLAAALTSYADLVTLPILLGILGLSMVLRKREQIEAASWVFIGALVFIGVILVLKFTASPLVPFYFLIPVLCATILVSEDGVSWLACGISALMLVTLTLLTNFPSALVSTLPVAILCLLIAFLHRVKLESMLGIVEWAVDIQDKDKRRAEIFFEQKQQIADALLEVQHANAKLEIAYARLEKAEQAAHLASQAKSVFMSNMSHELRTPLNVIIGYSSSMLNMPQMFENTPLHDVHRSYVELIEENGHYLLGLITDILDLSKIEAGKLELHRETIRLNQLFRGVIATSIGLVKDKPVQIRPDFDEALPPVLADPMRVRQILLNLMSNAIKFTSSGSVTLSARFDAAAGMVRISVIDTGIGIPQQALATIFDRFQQAERDTDKHYGGTGLGLDISKQLSQMHGGDLTVQSEVGKGSTFTITLPVVPGMVEIQGADQFLDDEAAIPTERLSVFVSDEAKADDFSMPVPIMLVEDEASLRDLIHKTLESKGYHVIVTHDGEEAVPMADALLPAAIILDIHLPGINGWEVLKQLRANPTTENIPVIVCTVDDPQPDDPDGITYLRKPITPENILASVSQVVSGQILNI